MARFLRPGKNVLAAVGWNDGPHTAVAQTTNRTGFLLQGDSEAEEIVNTDKRWLSIQNKAYEPIPITYEQVNGYVAIPPGERVDENLYQ